MLRRDLRTPSRSPAPTTAALDLDLEYTTHTPDAADVPPSPTSSVIDFPLFSSAPTRLRLRSESPPPDLWGAAVAAQSRPPSHYTAAPLPPTELEVAVSGEDILANASTPYAGCKQPWKVTHITLDAPIEEPTERRKRPGKKKRIQQRIKKKAEEEKEEVRKKSREGRTRFEGVTEAEKERILREEKTRKNREKSLKKKERERAKKAAGVGSGDVGMEG